MNVTQMNAALAIVSARAEPIIPEGWTVPNGYVLRGPRGNKGCVTVNANGNVDADTIRLWCDCVAYSDKRVAARRGA